MIDFITHYYNTDNPPFLSLSALPEHKAIEIMKSLYDDTPYGERFKHPAQYLAKRKMAEQWVRSGLIAKGGKPKAHYPIPAVLGTSKWIVKNAPDPEKHGEIQIPLSVFTKDDISFTYPDSMISYWFGLEKPEAFFHPDLHGIIFTLPEILSIVEQKGMPEEDWDTKLTEQLAPYIEAQIWNHALLNNYWKKTKKSNRSK